MSFLTSWWEYEQDSNLAAKYKVQKLKKTTWNNSEKKYLATFTLSNIDSQYAITYSLPQAWIQFFPPYPTEQNPIITKLMFMQLFCKSYNSTLCVIYTTQKGMWSSGIYRPYTLKKWSKIVASAYTQLSIWT